MARAPAAAVLGLLVFTAALLPARADPGDPDLKEALRLLESGRFDSRRKAAQDLGKMGPAAASAAPALVKALRDGEYGIREEAAAALGLIGVKDAAVLTALEKALKDPWPGAQIAAAGSLGRLDPDGNSGLPVLIGHLADPGKFAQTRRQAAEALVPYGPRAAKAVPALTSLLKDGDDLDRAGALDALAAIGAESMPALPQIAALAASEDHSTRNAAVAAVGALGPAAAPLGVPVLEAALKKADSLYSRSIVEALERMGPAAVPVLEGLLQRPDSMIVHAAIDALRAAKVPDERMIALLVAALDRTETFSGMSLVTALSKYGRAAVPSLVEVLRGRQRDAKSFALMALRDMGPAAEGAIPALEEVAASKDKDLAFDAAEILRRLRDAKGR
jgi:HEAT repeat protein